MIKIQIPIDVLETFEKCVELHNSQEDKISTVNIIEGQLNLPLEEFPQFWKRLPSCFGPDRESFITAAITCKRLMMESLGQLDPKFILEKNREYQLAIESLKISSVP